jgi:hypothetical protein
MSAHQLRYYQYVNRPYEQVRDALRKDTVGIFQRATTAAADRARAIVATLRASVGAVEVAADVEIQVKSAEEKHPATGPVTEIVLHWKAAKHPEMFPIMDAVLSVYPLSSAETQLDLLGTYQPPLGVVGAALDAMVGHRLAEASVHRFVEDTADRLRKELGGSGH